jgi:hypothetical protein
MERLKSQMTFILTTGRRPGAGFHFRFSRIELTEKRFVMELPGQVPDGPAARGKILSSHHGPG